MAHVVGVPKRDSCQKCQLPVFLAERMVVGKKIYHRTCLKCARCHAQLTPGSFYETEVDDEYCCETCPDEEELQSDALLRNNGTEIRRSVRNSIAERLAFFEATEEAAQKNISDEEKTKSLQRLGETAAVSQSAFKMSAAFNNFLSDAIDGELANKTEPMEKYQEEEEEDSEEGSEGNSLTSTPSVICRSDASSNEVEEAPPLPVTPSPQEKRFTTTAQLQIKLEQDNLKEYHEKPLPKIKLNNIPYNITEKENNTSIIDDKINNNGYHGNVKNSATAISIDEKEEEEEEEKTKIDLVENYITKDNTDKNSLVQKSAETSALEYAMKFKDNKININEQLQEELKQLESESSTDEEECVKAQQKEEEEKEIVEIRTKTAEDAATTERLSVVRARLQQFEDNNNNDKENDKIEMEKTMDEGTFSEKTLYNTEVNISPTTLENDKAAEEQEVCIKELSEEDNNLINENVVEMRDKNAQINESSEIDVRKTTSGKVCIEEYPEDLNPFKSDDENEDEKKKDKLNPFDSSDDEIELEKLAKTSRTSMGKVPPPRPPPPRISRNPFGDEPVADNNVENNFARRSSLSSSLNKRTPVPTPRSNM